MMQVCAACHSVQQLHFRNLVDVAYTEEEAKTMAADIEVMALGAVGSQTQLLYHHTTCRICCAGSLRLVMQVLQGGERTSEHLRTSSHVLSGSPLGSG